MPLSSAAASRHDTPHAIYFHCLFLGSPLYLADLRPLRQIADTPFCRHDTPAITEDAEMTPPFSLPLRLSHTLH